MNSEDYICTMAHSRFPSEERSSSGFMQNFLCLEPPIRYVLGFLPTSSMFLCNHLPRLSPERCIKLQLPFYFQVMLLFFSLSFLASIITYIVIICSYDSSLSHCILNLQVMCSMCMSILLYSQHFTQGLAYIRCSVNAC